jgi:hypothetical protein
VNGSRSDHLIVSFPCIELAEVVMFSFFIHPLRILKDQFLPRGIIAEKVIVPTSVFSVRYEEAFVKGGKDAEFTKTVWFIDV